MLPGPSRNLMRPPIAGLGKRTYCVKLRISAVHGAGELWSCWTTTSVQGAIPPQVPVLVPEAGAPPTAVKVTFTMYWAPVAPQVHLTEVWLS
jgi:hypothetical protein